MSGRPHLAVAGLLTVGIFVAAGGAWLRSRTGASADPTSLLPTRGLIVALHGRSLGRDLADLARFPLYRELLGPDPAPTWRRRLGWSAAVPDPWPLLPRAGAAALGLYRTGWVLVEPDASSSVGPWPQRKEGRWRLVASDASLLPSTHEAPVDDGGSAPAGKVQLRANLGDLLSGALGRKRGRGDLVHLLPSAALGLLQARSGELSERWSFDCRAGCLLDLLDPAGASGVEADGWSALPQDAPAVAWFRLDPRRLRELASGPPAEGESDLLERLDQLERFLDLPLRAELAASLAGPGVVAVLEPARRGVARPIAALDLAVPERARKAIDRIAALGMLSGSVVETSYRGVSIASWASGRRRSGWEPAAAVDGNFLLLAFHRSDLQDAVDRRRSAALGRTRSPLQGALDGMPRASWKASSRSPFVRRGWEEVAGVPPEEGPSAATATRSWLLRDRGRWVLEGNGASPAIFAEPLVPCLRSLSRPSRAPADRLAEVPTRSR